MCVYKLIWGKEGIYVNFKPWTEPQWISAISCDDLSNPPREILYKFCCNETTNYETLEILFETSNGSHTEFDWAPSVGVAYETRAEKKPI